jgi:hypothetical protein
MERMKRHISLPRPTSHVSLALVAAALLVFAATGCGSGNNGSSVGAGTQSASDFLRQITTQFSRGQSGRLWDTLHPSDQAVVSRDRYTACQRNEGFNMTGMKVLETYSDPVDIAGKTMPATAVSVRVTSDDGVTTATMHAVRVGGSWRWILSSADYAAYQKGTCPSSG